MCIDQLFSGNAAGQLEFAAPEKHAYNGLCYFCEALGVILTWHRFKSKFTEFGGVTQV